MITTGAPPDDRAHGDHDGRRRDRHRRLQRPGRRRVRPRRRLSIEVVHRFANGMQTVDGHLRWNLTGLYAEVLTGLAELASRYPEVVSIGIDTWAVDYGLLDADGRLLAEPTAYRDDRTEAVIADVDAGSAGPAVRRQRAAVPALQHHLPARRRAAGDLWSRAAHAVLLPDLLAYWLTGELRTEITNASTTGLLDARQRTGLARCSRPSGSPPTSSHRWSNRESRSAPITADVVARTGLPAGTRWWPSAPMTRPRPWWRCPRRP